MMRKSITLSLQEQVDAMKNKGQFAVSMSNPSFNSKNLTNINLPNYNLQGRLSGENKLKEIARKKLFSNWTTNRFKSNILITNGAKAALYCVFKSIANKKNNNFGIINPNWPTYIDLINLCNAKPLFYNTYYENNFDIDIKNLEIFIKRNKLKLLVLSSPNNPCGKIYDKKTISSLIKICSSNNCYLIIDESFSSIIFNKELKNIQYNLNNKHLIIINSFSKNFHLQGLRLGAILASEILIEEFTNIHIAINGAPNTISQYLISKFSPKLLLTSNLNKKKNFLTTFLKSKNIDFFDPDGSFYIFPKIKNQRNFFNLCNKKGLFYIKGNYFGSNKYNNFYRFCFEKKQNELEKIVKIMDKYELY